ncbi:MAG: helix-turn-helix domain-containing protein [Bacillota bacterium]|nr:helix-turn-helix domain-containing protein [Bacillota bacterium]
MDDTFINLSPDQMTSKVIDGIAVLKKYVAANSYFNNIFIVKGNDDTVYTSEGTVALSVLLRLRYKFSPEEKELFVLNTSDGKKHLNYFPQIGTMMYFSPLYTPLADAVNYVVFVIEMSSFTDQIADMKTAEYGMILLLDEEQRLLYTINADQSVNQDQMLPVLLDNISQDKFSYKEEKYILITQVTKDVHWTLVSIVPDKWIQGRMRYAYMIIWLITIIVIAISSALGLSRWNYNPIEKLSRILTSGILPSKPDSGDDLKKIETALVKYQKIGVQMQEQRILLQNQLIVQLLNGNTPSEVNKNHLFSILSMFDSDTEYCAVVIKAGDRNSDEVCRAVLGYIEEHYSSIDQAYAAKVSELVIGMIFRTPDTTEKSVGSFASKMHEHIMREYNTQLLFGVGRKYPLDRISISYMEAQIALNTMDSSQEHFIMHVDKLDNVPLADDDYQKAISTYFYSLQKPNLKEALAKLDLVCEMLRTRYPMNPVQQYYRFQLLEIVMQLLSNRLVSDDPGLSRQKGLGDLIKVIMPSCPLNEFIERMADITHILCSQTGHIQEKQEDEKRTQIIDWINTNICNPMLSLSMLSDAMGYSVPYWSHFFQDKLSIGFSDYIWCRRKQIVKDRLLRTNKPISDIVQSVGYLDNSSFIRHFKKDEGVTPGQYRSINIGMLSQLRYVQKVEIKGAQDDKNSTL